MTAKLCRSKDKELTMPTATYADTTVAVNDEGFFEDPRQWTEAMAPEIAKDQGIDELDRASLAGDKFMRDGVCRERNRTHRPSSGQDVRRLNQGALPAFSQRSGQDGGKDRRNTQATRLHLTARQISITQKGAL